MMKYQATNELSTIQAVVSKMTVKGLDAMKAIGNHETSFFDNGIVAGSGIWGECLVDELGHKSSGVVNQLEKLGLFTSYDNSDSGSADAGKWWELTALGADVANYLSGNLETTEAETVDEPAATDPSITVKVGTKWTYIYAADGSLLAEVRSDAAWLLDAAVMASCTK